MKDILDVYKDIQECQNILQDPTGNSYEKYKCITRPTWLQSSLP